MNRREALSKMTLLMGATLSSSTLSAMSRFGNEKKKTLNVGKMGLTDAQRKILAEVAEHILPKTSTPGAKDAGVPAFIELMMNDCYHEPDQMSFVEGLKELEAINFLNQSSADQIIILKALEIETDERMKAANVKQIKVGDNVDKETMDVKKGVPFWRLAKELTLFGYFTSEVGIKASFEYEPIPGKYELVKIKPGQKAFAH